MLKKWICLIEMNVVTNRLQSFKCSEFHQNICEELKKGLHGPDALHELEMLVANLMCVQCTCQIGPRSTANHSKIDRYIAIDWLDNPDQAFMSLRKFSFLVEFFNGFKFFLPT